MKPSLRSHSQPVALCMGWPVNAAMRRASLGPVHKPPSGARPSSSPLSCSCCAADSRGARPWPPGLRVTATVKTWARTGVEMEALTAVSIACLTIYDMLKAVDRSMTIADIRLLAKRGGASGEYVREQA